MRRIDETRELRRTDMFPSPLGDANAKKIIADADDWQAQQLATLYADTGWAPQEISALIGERAIKTFNRLQRERE